MTENHRPPGKTIIDIPVAVSVVEIRAFSLFDEDRIRADGLEGADGTVDSARDYFLRVAEKFFALFEYGHTFNPEFRKNYIAI
jgi:hypothetical protein